MPTGHPKTDAERRADALLDQIEANMKALRRLIGEGARAQAKLEAAKAALAEPSPD